MTGQNSISYFYTKTASIDREVGEFLAAACVDFGGDLCAERRLMEPGRHGTGLHRILMSRGCRSVSNFYVDLAILAARRGTGACGDPARPCIGTHAQLPVLERERARAIRHKR